VNALAQAAVADRRRPGLCVLLACFNRREKTLACLSALLASERIDSLQLHVLLVDDASTDGTAAAVNAQFPSVHVLRTAGNLFWCRSMHQAVQQALLAGHHQLLWLNDDVLLDRDAVARLLDCHNALLRSPAQALIVVGSTRDPAGQGITYGGERRRAGLNPLSLAPVEPTDQAQALDTFNGNLVLVNRAALALVGNLDPRFEHAMGDTDYGLRANRLGVGCWLAPGSHGVCSHNPAQGTYRDTSLPWRRRWQLIRSRKGLPVQSWWVFTRRHAGYLWPLLFAWPYLRLLLAALRLRLR
jgi:GT2 family glycosyltransferase